MNHDLLSLLITQTWQVTLLIVIVWTVVRLCARERPHLAHALWVLVLIKCLTPPIWSSPTSAFSWMNRSYSADSRLASVAEPDLETEPTGAESLLDPIIVEAVPEAELSATESLVNIPGSAKTPPPASSDVPYLVASWPQIISWTWMLGVILGLLVTILRFGVFLHWIRKSETSRHPALDETIRKLSRKLGVKHRVRARVLRSPVGPAVLGLLRPTVLLPESIVQGKSSAELEPLLAHELIHVRRGDLWWALVQTIARNLFWFHPLVWFAGRMATRESERSCDEETVACLGCRPAAYAKGLLDVLEHKHRLRVAPALPGVRPVEITSARLERVMNPGNGIHRRTPVWVWLLLLVSCGLVLPGAARVIGQEPLPPLAADHATPLPSGMLSDANPQAKANSENSKNESWRLQTYVVADLAADLNSFDKTGQFDLAKMLGCRMPGRNGKKTTPRGRKVTVGTPHGAITLGDSQPTMRIVDGILYAYATDKGHAKITESLAKFRKFGFRTVVVNTRMLTTSVDKMDSLGIEWSIAPVAARGVIRNAREESDPLRQKLVNEYAAQLIGTDHWSGDFNAVDADDIADAPGQQKISATSFVEKNSPVLFATLDHQQTQAVLAQLRGDVDSSIYQAPSVSMFNGQNAAIFSGLQRPFVIGLNRIANEGNDKFALQPVIRVISEGTILKLNARIIDGEGVNLDCRLECSAILNVETVQVPIRNHQEQPASIQVPEVATTRIQSSLDVPAGKTLVLSSTQRRADGERELFLAFLTCYLPDSENADAQVPEISMSPPEQTKAAEVACIQRIDKDGQVTFDPAEMNHGDAKAEPVRLTVRSEEPCVANANYQPLVEAMKSVNIAATVQGKVEFSVDDSMTTIRGKKLSIRIDDDQLQVAGDHGEMKVLSTEQSVFHFKGNVRFEFGEEAILRSDELMSDKLIGFQLNGSASIEVCDDLDGKWECSADSIRIDMKKQTMTLKGDARYVREGDQPAEIRAEYIEVNLETKEIRSRDAIPEPDEKDLFRFYQDIVR